MDILMERKLPAHYKDFSEASITKGHGFEAVLHYVVDIRTMLKKGIGLCLLGPNGAGKSGALAVAFKRAKAICPAWGAKDAMWCSANAIATSYGYNAMDQQFDEPVDALYNNARFLVVDELGREASIKNADHRQFNLLSQRRNNNTITCYTSNMNLDKILSTYGEGFHSLLHERCMIVTVGGPDRRRL
jgi:DNA replication protein DnaC